MCNKSGPGLLAALRLPLMLHRKYQNFIERRRFVCEPSPRVEKLQNIIWLNTLLTIHSIHTYKFEQFRNNLTHIIYPWMSASQWFPICNAPPNATGPLLSLFVRFEFLTMGCKFVSCDHQYLSRWRQVKRHNGRGICRGLRVTGYHCRMVHGMHDWTLLSSNWQPPSCPVLSGTVITNDQALTVYSPIL